MADRNGRGGGCWKVLGCGCVVVLALIAVGAMGVVANWSRIQSSDIVRKVRRTVEQGREAVGELQLLENELRQGLEARSVHLGATFDNRGRRVQVTIVDPVLPADSDPAQWAREVAVRVGERMAPIVDLDEIQVTIEERGVEGAARSARQYTFPLASLPELAELEDPSAAGASPPPAPSPEAGPAP